MPEQVDLSLDTLRAYERAGLMPRLRRPTAHLRCREADATGLELVACLWEMGPPMTETL